MQRTPEPELMDLPDQAEAYAAADFSASDAAFVTSFLEQFPALADGPVIDLGCGPGNIALRVAAALPDREVVGVDGSAAMLAIARREAARQAGQARFIEAFLPDAGLPAATFSAVVSNSLLHHLHDPQGLWATVRQVGAPGAAVWIGDLRRPATPEAAQALVDRYAAGDPDVLRQDFLASLHAAFEVEEVQAQLAAAGLDLHVEAVGDRHLRVWGYLG
ncbi:MAG: class I SAM-dependent methyltransferase [Myxococcales bacterium]|nr:class I SAM-dependent methyltransferase [Myxococcales bacterium]